MRAFRALPCFLGVLVLTALPLFAATTERVSLSNGGEEASIASYKPSISSDGRYVAFESADPGLVANDTNGRTDVFVRDRQTGQTVRASVASDGTEADGWSSAPCISADGRYVTFYSHASNLVEDDTNGQEDAFVHDMETGQTERVSVSSDGAQGDSSTYEPSISADGRYVAFWSASENLVPDKTTSEYDVFLHDRQTGQTERVSVSSDGQEANGQSQLDASRPVISADGRYVVFSSTASNLVLDDTNATEDIFVRDREAGATYRVSVATDSTQANGYSSYTSISADGRFVVFASSSSNLVADDTNGAYDVFVHDRDTGQTERVSLATDGGQADGGSYLPCISGDGRFVAFHSDAANLVPGDINGQPDIFVRDREIGVTVRVSLAGEGSEANGECRDPSISGDGAFVAFSSKATNLVTGDTNGVQDIFVRDRQTFPDVPVGFWAFYATEACFNADIVAGYEDGSYHPEWPVTRDQMAVYIARALAGGDGSVPDGPVTASFVDVPNTGYGDGGTDPHWAYKYVEYAADSNVVQGYAYDDPDNPGETIYRYEPTWTVTRDQMAVYVARAMAGGDAGVPDGPAVATFDDVPTDDWAYKYVEYCYANEVVQGYDSITYAPDVTVTRDQMVVFVQRAFDLPI